MFHGQSSPRPPVDVPVAPLFPTILKVDLESEINTGKGVWVCPNYSGATLKTEGAKAPARGHTFKAEPQKAPWCLLPWFWALCAVLAVWRGKLKRSRAGNSDQELHLDMPVVPPREPSLRAKPQKALAAGLHSGITWRLS